MSVIKLHLEDEESSVVARLANQLHVRSEDVLYTALDRLMLRCRDEELRREIIENSDGRRDNLAHWADTPRSVHAYEACADDETEHSTYV